MTLLPIPLLLALPAFAPAPVLTLGDEALAQRIETFVAPLAAAGHISGTLIVARGGEVLYEGSWGMANYELGVPNGPDSRFCVGAISAQMTNALVTILLDEGVLSADDTIDRWIEDFPQGDKITVAHLRDYEAGLPNHIFEPEERTRAQTTADAVEAAKRHELMFEPGTRKFFSFGSYCVLAYVLEQASGRSYAQLMAEKVFGPAGMEHSAHVAGGALLPKRSAPYRVAKDGLLNAIHEDVSYLTGSSSVWSTPRDLYRFYRAVTEGTLGEPVRERLAYEGEFHWVGVFSCYRALADYWPETDVFVAYTGNVRTGAIDLLRLAMPQLVAGEDLGPARIPPHEAVAVPDEVLEPLVGVYEIPGNELTMRLEDGSLFLNDWILIPIGEDRFFSPMDYADVAVTRNEDGEILNLRWTMGGRTLGCRKLR